MPLLALPNAFGDAATNMAIDAALLASLPDGIAVFRHYGWTEPALTFGYSQSYSAVKATAPSHLTLCRRLTGGGIVDHRDDWTYALIIQRTLPPVRIPANRLYSTIHLCIQAALKAQSIDSRLAPCLGTCPQSPPKKSSSPDQCFVAPATSDVLRPDGIKIAGAAMKRSRSGLLIQGSIARATLPLDFDFERFRLSLIAQLAQALEIPIATSEDLRTLFHGAKIEEERLRFASAAWVQKR